MRVRVWLVLLLLMLSVTTAWAADKQLQTVRDVRAIVLEMDKHPALGIPPVLLGSAHALAVIPNLIKAGFILGGRYGRGVVLVRQASGEWSAPVFVKLVGGSVGWQFGAQESDVILLFRSPESVAGIFKGKYTLGMDASVAAGPVGRRIEGVADLQQSTAQIYSYSRNRGLFAGVSLAGAALDVDQPANENYYQLPGVTSERILAGDVGEQPLAGQRLLLDLRDLQARAERSLNAE